MKFTERKEWLYDPLVFQRKDTQTALRIHREWTKKHSPNPAPKFFEVDRATAKFDQLWHVPLDDRTVFSRTLEIPAINTQEKPQWRLTKIGLVPQRKDKFTMSNLILQEFDYFPNRGDLVFYNGYRYMIVNVVIEPNAYWHQTNVWMGLVVECMIPPEGDARPVPNLSVPTPSEMGQTRPLPEV
jgi:hypothetical protein